jgi:transcriptional regulator GlxA family with amidase domain
MLSRNHLLRHFRQLFGHSPHQYLTAVRLEKAKTLLMQSALPVREVGGATGFESPSSFGRLFKSVLPSRRSSFACKASAESLSCYPA